MTTTTDSQFTLRADGSIVLPDDDGDPTYYLQPDQAFALEQFITENRSAIDTAVQKHRTVSAYRLVADLIGAGLPVPTYLRLRWDGRLVIDLDTDEQYDAWTSAVDGEDKVDEHPNLGRRDSKTSHYFELQGRWVSQTARCTKCSGALIDGDPSNTGLGYHVDCTADGALAGQPS